MPLWHGCHFIVNRKMDNGKIYWRCSKCTSHARIIMGLDLLGLDILGIILYAMPITLHVGHACAANLLQQSLFTKITNFVLYGTIMCAVVCISNHKHSQVLRVLGCRTCNLTLVVYKSGEEQLCVEQNPELFTDTGRGGASMQCMLPSCMSPLP